MGVYDVAVSAMSLSVPQVWRADLLLIGRLHYGYRSLSHVCSVEVSQH